MGHFPPPQQKESSFVGALATIYGVTPKLNISGTGDDFLAWGLVIKNFGGTGESIIVAFGDSPKAAGDLTIGPGETVALDHFSPRGGKVWMKSATGTPTVSAMLWA